MFAVRPEAAVYKRSTANRFFQLGAADTIAEGLALRLRPFSTLCCSIAVRPPTSATFDNKCLASHPACEAVAVEMWMLVLAYRWSKYEVKSGH